MTEQFIEKRIDEQVLYIKQVAKQNLTFTRKIQILVSATQQLIYFTGKLAELYGRR